MNRPTRKLGLAVLLMALLGCDTGCARFGWKPVAAGQSEILVNAERADQASFAVLSSFLEFENEHRDLARGSFPAIHRFAEDLRRRDPVSDKSNLEQIFDASEAAIDLYRQAPSPEAGAEMNAKLDHIADLVANARKFLVMLQTGVPSN